jgi:tight adherence protein B
MSLLPLVSATYVSHLGMALAGAALLYAGRAKVSQYFGSNAISTTSEEARKAQRELFLIGVASSGLIALVLIVIGLPPAGAFAFAVAGMIAIPRILKGRRQRAYVRDFDAALAESLQTVSSSLRAGLTLKDSLYVAADNSPKAFASEVSLALKEYHFGMPIEEALDKVRQRVKTPNCNIAFGSMIISSRLGGKLPEMLKQIVKTIRERERVEGKLKALTAQGRAQAFLLCAAPPVLGFGLYLYDKNKMALLTDYWVGQILLSIAIVLELVGIFVTSRVLRLEV